MTRTTPNEEVYNIKELALALGAPWQTVMAWKRSNQIPSASMTPDGKFIKSVIAPFIEWYRNDPDTPKLQGMGRQVSLPQNNSLTNNDSQTQNDSQGSDMAKKTKKITYSPEVRQKALRLLTEKKLSAYEVAKRLGCSNATVLSWQKKEQASAAATETKATPKASEEAPAASVNPSPKTEQQKSEQQKLLPETDFDIFMRNYWNEGTRAVDVLLLPPEIGPKVLNYVNEALKYSFETLR